MVEGSDEGCETFSVQHSMPKIQMNYLNRWQHQIKKNYNKHILLLHHFHLYQ